MILVAGGTGVLGSRLVGRLVGRGLPVRVLTRDPARAHPLFPEGAVEVVRGDVRDPRSLPSALRGTQTVVSAVHGFVGPRGVSPATVDRDGNANLVGAAAAEGSHVVLVSVVGASVDHPMELFRAKHAAEQTLVSARAAWTVVRATAFVETWGTILAEPLRSSGRILVFGRGDNPINFVSAGDVAAAVEQAVVDPTLRNRIVEVGGPENHTFNELAALVEETVGRRARLTHVPRAALRIRAISMALPRPGLARQARAALAMDSLDLTFDSSRTRQVFPDLALTDARQALKELLA